LMIGVCKHCPELDTRKQTDSTVRTKMQS
jgi:hypothetical protein